MILPEVSKAPTLRQQVYDSVKSAIVSGQLKPGERVTEEGIGKFLGVSRTPAHEVT